MSARVLAESVPNHHVAVDCPTTDCAHVTDCTVCDVALCVEHSNEFTTCAAGGMHHRDCCLACVDCLNRAREEG